MTLSTCDSLSLVPLGSHDLSLWLQYTSFGGTLILLATFLIIKERHYEVLVRWPIPSSMLLLLAVICVQTIAAYKECGYSFYGVLPVLSWALYPFLSVASRPLLACFASLCSSKLLYSCVVQHLDIIWQSCSLLLSTCIFIEALRHRGTLLVLEDHSNLFESLSSPLLRAPTPLFKNHSLEDLAGEGGSTTSTRYYRLTVKDKNNIIHRVVKTYQDFLNLRQSYFELSGAYILLPIKTGGNSLTTSIAIHGLIGRIVDNGYANSLIMDFLKTEIDTTEVVLEETQCQTRRTSGQVSEVILNIKPQYSCCILSRTPVTHNPIRSTTTTTYYLIRVEDCWNHTSWEISKRYRQFWELNTEMESQKISNLPIMPNKRSKKNREELLQAYLDGLCTHPEVQSLSLFHGFLSEH